MSASSNHLAACAASLVLAAAAATAAVDVEVRNGDKVTGTLAPATEKETLRFRVPKGALVTVKAAAAKKPLQLHALLKDPNGTPVGVAVEGKSVLFSKKKADLSGLYSVEISSRDGTTPGDYTFSATWKSPTLFGGKTTFTAGAAPDVAFAADAGATATFAVKKAKKSAASPELDELNLPNAGVDHLAGATSKRTLGLTGDYSFGIKSATDGDATATVKIKPPAASRRRYELTTKALGVGGAATSGIVGPAGGTVTALPGAGGQIEGSAVTFPPGALPVGTSIVISSAPPIATTAVQSAAGATVAFGPEGATFGTKAAPKSATVTIPFDVAFAAKKDDVVVSTRDAKGKVTTVAKPYVFDLVAGTVSFQTSHFSSFRAVAPATVGPGTGAYKTLATVGDGRDVCDAFDTGPGAPLVAFIAEGSARKVTAVRQPIGGNFVAETWVGGGSQQTVPSPRLQFQFPADVVSVYQNASGFLWIATPTQIFGVDMQTGTVTLRAGTGAVGDGGDGGLAVQATFTNIRRILADQNATLYVADLGTHRIRKIDPLGNITAFAGAGAVGVSPEGDALATTSFVGPTAMTFGRPVGLYVADGARIRWLSQTGPVGPINQTIAGSAAGATGAGGDGGPPLAATWQSISSVATLFPPIGSNDDLLLVADDVDHVVREVNLTAGTVTLIAGAHGTAGFDGENATLPGLLSAPNGLFTRSARFYVSDKGNQRVREVRLP